jgi:frataxin-like iron-binding protein CyaY
MRDEILQIFYDEREKCFNVNLDEMAAKILQLFNDKIDSAEDEIVIFLKNPNEVLGKTYPELAQYIINIIKERCNK